MTPSIQRRLALNIGFGMAVTAAGVAAFLSIFTADAYPHDAKSGWAYPIACCAGFDCGEIPASTVQERPDGYHVTLQPGQHPMVKAPMSFIWPYARARSAPDGLYHACISAQSKPLCFFAGSRGS
mgnify:CR=1 FL=1